MVAVAEKAHEAARFASRDLSTSALLFHSVRDQIKVFRQTLFLLPNPIIREDDISVYADNLFHCQSILAEWNSKMEERRNDDISSDCYGKIREDFQGQSQISRECQALIHRLVVKFINSIVESTTRIEKTTTDAEQSAKATFAECANLFALAQECGTPDLIAAAEEAYLAANNSAQWTTVLISNYESVYFYIKSFREISFLLPKSFGMD